MLKDMENLGLLQEVEVGRWMRIQRNGQNGHGKNMYLCKQFMIHEALHIVNNKI